MANPNQFTMNTDYMSIAQNGKYEHHYTINSGTIQADDQKWFTQTFKVPYQKGAIDQYLTKLNNFDWQTTSGPNFELESGVWAGCLISRQGPDELLVEFYIGATHTANYPVLNFTVKGIMFKPPNVF